MNVDELKKEQLKFAKKVVIKDDYDELFYIGGVDQAFVGEKVISAVIVMEYKTMKIVEKKYAVVDAPMQYIPGFLSYREGPAIVGAVNKLNQKPDILLVDGNGILHPRKIGLASHVGILLDIPTIGVAKKLLMGIEEKMPKKLDEFVENLQKKIMKMEIEDHNERIVSLCYNPQNWGKLLLEDITSFEEQRGGPKNYFLGLYLNIENNIIKKVSFLTDGCGVMIATGSQTTILIEGKTIEFAENLKIEDIDKALMGIPENENHCLDLAVKTLKRAIEKYKSKD